LGVPTTRFRKNIFGPCKRLENAAERSYRASEKPIAARFIPQIRAPDGCLGQDRVNRPAGIGARPSLVLLHSPSQLNGPMPQARR